MRRRSALLPLATFALGAAIGACPFVLTPFWYRHLELREFRLRAGEGARVTDLYLPPNVETDGQSGSATYRTTYSGDVRVTVVEEGRLITLRRRSVTLYGDHFARRGQVELGP